MKSREPAAVRILPGDPRLGSVLEVWTKTYGAPDASLADRLGDGRSLLFALFDGGAVAGFVHFRDRKAAVLDRPGADDETSRVLAEAPEFAVMSFEQLYFAGGRWAIEAAVPPIFRAAEEHLRRTTVRWALLGHLHSDRCYFDETARVLEALGFRLRPGDYVGYRLDLPPIDSLPDPAAGDAPEPYVWRLFRDEADVPVERTVEVYQAIFPDDPPAEALRRDIENGVWGPLSGVAHATGGGAGEPVGIVLAREREKGILRIDRLGVVPTHRGRGVISGCFLGYARRCREEGIEAFGFQVRSTNDRASGLVAARLGARVVKVERFYVRTGEGEATG